MKKILASLVFLISSQLLVSQSVIKTVWKTDFEHSGLQPPCSDTTSYKGNAALCSCTPQHGFDWGINDSLHFNGSYCDTAQVHINDTLWFSTCAFSTLLDTFVTVEFQHICKVSFFDGGIVEVSNDSGQTWHKLGATEYINTKGLGQPQWQSGYGVFNDVTYAHVSKWSAFNQVPPQNSWWEYEYFNASAFLGGLNGSSNCMVRWSLFDGPVQSGHENYYGWLLDSIRIKSSPCEIIKPYGEFVSPIIYHGSLLYSLGPFNIYAKMYDLPVAHSGYKEAYLVYSVNGGPLDSVLMNTIPTTAGHPNTADDSVYLGVIPRVYSCPSCVNGVDSFKGGDSVCYWVNIYDKSFPCRNKYHIPNDPGRTCNEFYLTNGFPLPYCDDFELSSQAGFWDTVMFKGTIGWELGNPLAGGGYSAHSGTKTWTTVLAGMYQNKDEYYLRSPIFDFSKAVTPRISFWHRHQMPTSSTDADRLRLEYSINGNNWLWLGFGNDPAGKKLNQPPTCPSTWYNQSNGWSGNWVFNNQWREAFYQLPASFTAQNQVQFRFVFLADNNFQTGYGASIDDWCLYNPPKIDVSALDFIRPPFDYIKKAGEKDSVCYRVRNIGTDTLLDIPLTFVVLPKDPNIVQQNDTFKQNLSYPHGIYQNGLPALAVDTFCFDTTAFHVIPKGFYTIKGYPEIIGDADSSNDTTETFGHFGFVTDTITHYENFDSVPVKWATTRVEPGQCGSPPPPTPTRWQLGKPNWGVTNSTYSPSNSWDINLTAPYDNNAFELLYSNFFDMTNADSAFLSFWHNRYTTKDEDGYYIDYSFDRGFSWTRLTAGSQPIGVKVNWTNSYPPLYGNFGAGWSGLTSGWEYSQCPLNNSNFTNKSEVMFRFVFRTSPKDTADGVSIDDFRIVNPDKYDAEMFDIIQPERGCVLDIAEPVEIVVKNTGKDYLTNIPVRYRYRFDATCSNNYGPYSQWFFDTIPGPINPGLTGSFIFMDSVNMSVFGCYQFCAITEHPLDKNQENDTICGYKAENVRGCDIELKINTGQTKPDSMMLLQDSITGDTLWMESFTPIAANVIQWTDNICLPDLGTYKFKMTCSDTTMIQWFRMRDPFADTTVLQGKDPGTFYFSWTCPPLLSAATERVYPHGPAPMPIPQTYLIDVRTRNKGSIKLSYVWQTTVINQTLPLCKKGNHILTFTDSLWNGWPGDPILFPRLRTIDTIWKAEPGQYEICSWTWLPNGNADSATFDDTACLIFTVLDTVRQIPYCNDFDNDSCTNPWASLRPTDYDTTSTFKLGKPAQTTINSAKSPQRAWFTNLTKNYVILDKSAVFSPLFILDTSKCYNVSFDHIFKTEHSFDGGTVEYTLDSGRIWRTVGGPYNPLDSSYVESTKNWFNTPFVTGLGGAPHPPGWTGKTENGNWWNSFRDIHFPDIGMNPIVVGFRFRFGADASVQNEGWAFDNFCFTDTGHCIYYSCYDGIKNGFEQKIDCGGPDCEPWETCIDGVLNQNEVKTDCGGVCPPCASCFDNKKNGLETDRDCGGPDCAPCGSCNDGIQSENWVHIPGPPVDTVKVWEKGVDCGGPCPPCWLGVDEVDPNILFLGQTIPNPARDITTVSYQLPKDGQATVVIRSTLGVEVYRNTLDQKRGIYRLDVDVSAWASGLYYYSIEFNGERLIDKMVVSHE